MDLDSRSEWVVVKTTIREENAESVARTNPVHGSGQQRLSTTSVNSRCTRDHRNIQSTLIDGTIISGCLRTTV